MILRTLPHGFTFGYLYTAAFVVSSMYSGGARGQGQGTQDNHKPVFTNCSYYHPSVKEEEPTGTFVFRVTAMDRDPPDTGGSISYAFVAQPNYRPKFSIDNRTGEIRTRHMFDRDEPSREKEVYLTVRATDNGNPQLDDICTIKVTIEDINDNTPVFDKVNYQESVPQDLKRGNEVMRISATDIDDGNNSRVIYDLEAKVPADSLYFHVDKNTGVIYLDKEIDRDPGYHFRMRATATDQGEVPNSASIDLEILVVESHKKAPSFVSIPASPIYLAENMSNFNYNIATFTAQSNTDEKAPVFVLVVGRTEQTNKQSTFRLETDGTTAHIRLARHLDYETVSEYLLTIRIQNKYSLAAETTIKIQLEDVNDMIPVFTEGTSGHVLENEPAGTAVMQVQAIDIDGTSANNKVTYELADNQENFAIDPITGNITTLKTFDREEKDFYNVKVIAWDNSPSALFNTGVHNYGQQVFRIEIADKNDHAPKFTQERYVAEAIPEDANNNALVTEVKAIDNDTASLVTYSIVEGNIDNAFLIEPQTGKIRVNGHLDYENITSYTLKVRANDGVYEDYAHVDIKIENVNDNPPVFYPYKNNITIMEEHLEPGCIAELRAYDPDIPDRNEPQHIVYSVVPKQDQHLYLTITNNGCLSLLKPLDRDPPKGSEIWQVLIQASDQDGTPQNALTKTTEVLIRLQDINDNAPFLNMSGPVVWRENRPPGNIVRLEAQDYDGPDNRDPFRFQIASSASPEIQSKFGVSDDKLTALVTFDREERKSYQVQIAITDSGIPPMTGTSTLLVTIGDENDNPMKPGFSDIFVYNYKGEAPDTEIGRVYVEDLDDWDLPDKKFRWANKSHPQFDLSDSTGMITMLKDTQEGSYLLEFLVTEESHLIPRHTVEATVNVTIKEIPEEAVDKSGSIRLYGTSAEDFISPDSHGLSKKSLLHARLAHMLNTSLDNVDVFTVLHSTLNENQTLLDVRFSAHGSPYYAPERINQAITSNWVEVEKSLGVKILMVNIDECLQENGYCGDSSCSNFLKKSTVPMAVYTNTTSFVGVNAIVNPLCTCDAKEKTICHNGGTPVGSMCECMPGFEGPNCEILAIGFRGDGWALYPSFPPCEDSHLSLELQSYKQDGLVFYIGPTNPHSYGMLGVQDFMSLELHHGYPVLLVDFGTGTVKIEHKHIKVSDGAKHRIDIIWSKTSIELQVDNCRLLPCLSLTAPTGPHKFLNVNGPLQLGGTHVKLASVAEGMNWTFRPLDNGFSGCIRNLTFNQKLYNLGMPSISKNADPGCSENNMAEAISFGINSSFIIAVLICLASLLILLLAVVVHRKKTDDMYKDTDDIRENIINYEDEGGGEGDMTGYDLNVLRLMYDDPLNEKQMPNNTHLIQRPDDVPDICGFLDGKKQSVDNDPETNPFDDVRHYAYEGDGNTTGSLSSLASGTDEGDLNFDYLSNFGPRFRKLADMYGEDPSDEEDDNFHNAASESWC